MSNNFVIGRTEKSGNLQDVRVHVNADGLNRIDIARDPRDLSSRTYIVDRRALPDKPWRRLLEVESFSDSSPENLSEVRANIDFEVIPNAWGIDTIKTWGLPEGMESPWFDPIEMVGNELLLSEETIFVSGDAPVNTIQGNTFKNGKYEITVTPGGVTVSTKGRFLAEFATDTSSLRWSEGISGAISFSGGSIYLEPAKPPLFLGEFILNSTPLSIREGLYEYHDAFMITSSPMTSETYIGALSIISDPFPERWIPRVFCRAYVDLISPAYKPPLTEEEPKRISIRVEYPENDFPGIEPEVITPYSNDTGVFNSWDIPNKPVMYGSKERPWDIMLPFRDLQDWGGYPVEAFQELFPAEDFLGMDSSAFPSLEGFELPDIPQMPEGMIYMRWKDSAQFWVIRNEWINIFYREGWIYHQNKVSPDSSGVVQIFPQPGWNNLKIYWNESELIVNDRPGLTEERRWGDVLTAEGVWGNVVGINSVRWKRDPDYPIDVEQYEEIPVTWVTGVPEGEAEPPPLDYSEAPRLWGRVLYEHWEENLWVADTRLFEISSKFLKDLNA